jgi:hypothetical protein
MVNLRTGDSSKYGHYAKCVLAAKTLAQRVETGN